MKTIVKLWMLIAILIVLTPIGIVLPQHFRAGAAWGEWTKDEIKALGGYLPKGMEKLSSLWNAPMSGYAKGGLGYIICAILGVMVISGVIFIAGKFLNKKDQRE